MGKNQSSNQVPLQLCSAESAPQLSLARVGRSRVVAVGGGKGGTGKSLLSSNLGLFLARTGREIILLDADLGGANLHTCLGINCPGLGLSDYLGGRVRHLEEVRAFTPHRHLSLINGAKDAIGIANLRYTQKKKLMDNVRRLHADLVLLDLGAGTGSNMIDFFVIADLGLVVITPEPPSIENAYRFIRASVYRRVQHWLTHHAALSILEEELSPGRNSRGASPQEVFQRLRQVDRASYETVEMALSSMRVCLVLNMLRGDEDFKIGRAMEIACRKYFGIEVDFLGGIRYDDAVWRSVRRKEPFLSAEPSSLAALDLCQIADAVHRRLFQKSP